MAKVALDALDGSSEEDAEEDLEKLTNELQVYQDLASLQGVLIITKTCRGIVVYFYRRKPV